jgi:hypothetical protein
VSSEEGNLQQDMAKKTSKRLPLAKKPPKVEIPKKAYSRKRAKKEIKKILEQEISR